MEQGIRGIEAGWAAPTCWRLAPRDTRCSVPYYNGSKLFVLNGLLITVSGVSSTGAPSTLNINGALVNFGGVGGNQVIIRNAIAPTAQLGGIPVNKDAVSSISIGPNPIENGGTLGTMSVTGSMIQATGGGRVTITAP